MSFILTNIIYVYWLLIITHDPYGKLFQETRFSSLRSGCTDFPLSKWWKALYSSHYYCGNSYPNILQSSVHHWFVENKYNPGSVENKAQNEQTQHELSWYAEYFPVTPPSTCANNYAEKQRSDTYLLLLLETLFLNPYYLSCTVYPLWSNSTTYSMLEDIHHPP